MLNKYNQRVKKIEEYISHIFPNPADKNWVLKEAGIDIEADAAGLGDSGSSFLEYVKNINSPMHDLISRGGKRWRPMLMLLLYEAKCADYEKILTLVPLIELSHNGTLVIDDIEDSADQRRGLAAVHKIYGSDTAINSANFVYFLAFSAIDSSSFSEDKKYLFYKYYVTAMKRLHIGQGLDIQWHKDHTLFPPEKDYYTMCKFKTGSLSRLAAEIAVTAADGALAETSAINSACENMGLGFQILDDVINLSAGNPGKKRGDDIVEGKKSLPVILFKESGGNVKKLSELFAKAAVFTGKDQQNIIDEAIALLEKTNSIDAAKEKALQILDSSKKIIGQYCAESEVKDIIFFIFDSFAKPVKMD